MTRTLSISFLAASLAALAVANPLSTTPDYVPRQRSPVIMAPVLVAEHEAPHGIINNSYIVMLKKDLPQAAVDNHYNFLQVAHSEDPLLEEESGLRHVYDGHVRGYAGRFSQGVLQRIRQMPEVDYIERDQIVKTQAIQKSAPWGLARVSHRPRLTFGTFTKYEYEPAGGLSFPVYPIAVSHGIGKAASHQGGCSCPTRREKHAVGATVAQYAYCKRRGFGTFVIALRKIRNSAPRPHILIARNAGDLTVTFCNFGTQLQGYHPGGPILLPTGAKRFSPPRHLALACRSPANLAF
ncbi:hypothetical protein EVG20_g1402 [Dentipellis fragilis]|uniref:Inhibitor I9 domain-containing protein n=1 Tax=Dentipellis fragilis TaxID=205917 RepID=A0A4Y9ZDX8_9AGAM|nr:hypothetical protein EVG20_g1402 [Dentipellis fragilis]